MKCEDCKQETVKQEGKTIIIKKLGIKVETQDHDKGIKFNEIKIPENWRLLRYDECVKLHNNKEWRKQLNLEDCWFWIEQPFKFNKEKNPVAWFWAISVWVDFGCYGDPLFSLGGLGVRFCRDIKKGEK